MNQKYMEKLMLKSRVAEMYKSCEDIEIKKQTLLKYQELLEENVLLDKTTAVYQRAHIYPAIAVYRTYMDFAYGSEEIEKIMEQAMYSSVKSTGEFFAKAGRYHFFFSFFKKMCFLSTKFSYKLPYFEMQWIESEQDVIAWNCHKCFYHDEFQRYGCPNLTKIFCKLDDVMYGNIPVAHWERTKTIGEGEEICDFRFVQSKV